MSDIRICCQDEPKQSDRDKVVEDSQPVKKEKELFIDRFLHMLIDEHLDKTALSLMVILAVIIRLCLMGETNLSPDYNTYYLDWVNQYRNYGFLEGLGKSIGDYYVPYNIMYAICALFPVEPYIPLTLFSTIAELVSAYYAGKIVALLLEEKNIPKTIAGRCACFVGAATLFLPFVALNGSLWKQCDAIYVVFLVISIYQLLRENYRAAFVFLSVSFGFKLQAVFFIPVFLVCYMIRKGFGILEFAWIPAMYFILGLPSVLCRKGIRATYLAYFSQTQETSTEGYGMVSFYPNFYNFGLDDFDGILKLPAVVLTACILIMIAVFAYHNRTIFEEKGRLLLLGIYMAWTCCMFLPGMHERYDYAIVLLLSVYAAGVCKKLIPAAIAVNLCSLYVYIIVLFGRYEMSMIPVTIAEIIAYFYVGYYVFRTKASA